MGIYNFSIAHFLSSSPPKGCRSATTAILFRIYTKVETARYWFYNLAMFKTKMPTILFIYGWRLFFYSNESNEPIHIHVQKGDIEAKYWLLIEEIEIIEAFSYNFTPVSKKEIKKIIYQHFDLIVSEWSKHFLNNGKDA